MKGTQKSSERMDYTIKLNASPAGYGNNGPCRVLRYNSKLLREISARDLRSLYRELRRAGVSKYRARRHVISATTAVWSAKNLELPHIDTAYDLVRR